MQSSEYPAADAGAGNLADYRYDLRPKNKSVTLRLAGSDQHQAEIERIQSIGAETLEVFIAMRTAEEERTDAPMPARFFVESRMSSVVGFVPRGLEPVVLEAVTRLEQAGRSTRIPAEISKTKAGLRVTLLMGKTR